MYLYADNYSDLGGRHFPDWNTILASDTYYVLLGWKYSKSHVTK